MSLQWQQLILGSAQLGVEGYGISNNTGRLPAREESLKLIRSALDAGVGGIDTARDYGIAEEIIGQAIQGRASLPKMMVTKLKPIGDQTKTRMEIRKYVEEAVSCSLAALGISSIPVVLLHDWQERGMGNRHVWNALIDERNQGRILKIGVSAHSPEEALCALQEPDLAHLQIPCNLLDNRWEQVEKELLQRREIVVHARSVFLQGVFFLPPERWPNICFDLAASFKSRMNSLCIELKRENIRDLAIAWARSQPWVHGVVIGMESVDQLAENLKYFSRPALEAGVLRRVREVLRGAPERLLDPSTWPTS